MPSTVLLVGTRKGCFVLESDEGRRDWSVRGPYCEGWPIYHAVHDPGLGHDLRRRRERVARRGRLAQPRSRRDAGSCRARASATATADAEALEDLGPDRGARTALRRRRGGRRVREPRRRRDLVAPQHARRSARAASTGTTRRTSLPGTSACRRSCRTPTIPPASGSSCRGSASSRPRRRRVLDAAQPRPARRLAARGPRGRLLRPQARDVAGRPRPPLPAEPLRHASQRRRRAVVGRDHRGPAVRLRVRRGSAPARPRQLLRDPARSRARPLHARGPRGGLAHARRRVELAAARARAAAAATRTSACCARGWRSTPRRARPLLRDEHGAGVRERRRGRDLERDRELPAARSRRSRSRLVADVAMAEVHLPIDAACRSSPACRAGSSSTRPPWARRSSSSTSAGPACATGSASPGQPPRCGRTSTSTSTASAPRSSTALEARSRVDVIAAISGG